ncbi:MAG: PKD domain-containing protein, partial [Solirubrobacterales bacterium]
MLVQGPGSSLFVPPAQISANADVPTRNYTLRGRSGEAGQLDAHGGLSLRKLVAIAGFDPDQVGFVTVPRADGTTAYLPGAYLSEPPPFPEGPALVWVDANSTHFFRPVIGPEDVNAGDNIAADGGEALPIGVHEGALLEVGASASQSAPDSGQAIRLSASASGALPGEQLSYQWSFGDGTGDEGKAVSHAFSGSGTFEVTVTVVGDRDSGGQSSPLAILVGDPPHAQVTGSTSKPGERHGGRPAGAGGGTGAGRGTGTGDG